MDAGVILLFLLGAVAASLLVVPIKDQKLFWFVVVPLGTLAVAGAV